MKLTIVFLLSFLTYISLAQDSRFLILEHRERSKEVVFSEGEYIVVKSLKGETVRGALHVVDEKLIRVRNKVISLTNVESIGKRNIVLYKVASLMVTNGLNLLVYGLNENLRNGWDNVSSLHKASLPMLGLGIPMLTFTYKRKVKKWTYEGVVSYW